MAYYRPDTLNAALEVLSETGATVAAGCTDLFPATQTQALAGPVLDITGIESLRGIDTIADHIRIGAATTWTDLIRAPLPPAFDALEQAGREVGSVQIQNAGTLAGNLCNASPAADGVPALLILDADVELASLGGVRHLPLQKFLTGPRRTALQPGELVSAVRVPVSSTAGRSRFLKLGARRYLVISIAIVAVRLTVEAGQVAQVALAVGSCGPVATRLRAQEAALVGCRADASLADRIETGLVAPALSPIGDIRADAAYRTRAAVDLLRRALRGVAEGSGAQAA